MVGRFSLVGEKPFVVGFDGAPAEMLLLFGGEGNSSGGGIGRMLVAPSSEFLSMIGTEGNRAPFSSAVLVMVVGSLTEVVANRGKLDVFDRCTTVVQGGRSARGRVKQERAKGCYNTATGRWIIDIAGGGDVN